LRDLLEDLRYTERRVERLERDIRRQLEPHADVIGRLRTIPGVDETTAWTIISEIGLDMTQFPTANHLASWAGLCPGNEESAGKRRSGRTRKGNRYLRRTLVQNAWAVGHSEGNFLNSLFLRLARRKGMKKAAMAVAHRLLIIAYYIIRDGVEYRELGGDHHDRLHPLRSTRRLVERLAGLGFEVELRPKEPAVQEVQPETSVPRKRGRPKGSKNRHPYTRSYPAPSKPCSKCATRGIPCIHQPPSTPTDSPAHCRQCSTWGLPACIHAKNFFKTPSNRSSSEDPAK